MKKSVLERITAILCVLALSTGLFSGCGRGAGSSAASSVESVSSESDISNVLTVQVQSVDGNTVTAVKGEIEQQDLGTQPDMPPGGGGTPPDGAAGAPPEMPAGDGGTPPDGAGASPEMPAGGAPGNGPGASGAMMQFVEGAETITFAITDATTITVEFLQGSQEGSVESIVTGAVLEITLDKSSNATDIVVKTLAAGGGLAAAER